MNDSPVVTEPDTPRAVRIRHRTLLQWRVHGAETAAVALGTAAVGMQWARSGPSRRLTDDAAVALMTARADGGAGADAPVWLRLMALGPDRGTAAAVPDGWYAGALALLCLAGALYAASGTLRTLRGRRAWPFTLGAAAVVAVCPPLLQRLFSGTGGALSLLVVAVTVRVMVTATAQGRLARPDTAAMAGLLAGLGAGAVPAPAGAALVAVYPAALLFAGRRRGTGRGTLWGGAVYAGVWATAATVPWPTAGGAWAAGGDTAGVAAVAGAVALGACAAGSASVPARLAAVVVGTVLLLSPAGIPAAVAPAVCGAVLLAGRGATARIVGGTVLAGAVGLLWATALGPLGGAVLVSCALAATAAALLPLPAVARSRWLRTGPAVLVPPRSVVVGVLVTGTLVSGTAWSAPAAPPAAEALCFTEARYGHLFAGYAERLGLRYSTVALASPGGPLALGRQRVLDLRGRTDPHIASARAAHDDAALRRYLFVRARPEFVHVDADEAARTGLTAQRLAAHGYRPLLRQGAGGDYVHRSAVTVPGAMPELRAWARARTVRLDGCAPER